MENLGENKARLPGGRICCPAGIVLGLDGIILALLGGSPGASSGAVGIDVVGYLIGSRRLWVATVMVGLAALFFAVAVSAGIGLEPAGHGYPG